MNFRKTMLVPVAVITATLALLEVLARYLDMPTAFRWANMMQLAWASLALLGAMEAWPSKRVLTGTLVAGVAMLLGIVYIALGRLTGRFSVTSAEQALLSMLVGFWAGTTTQVLKASFLVRSVAAACFLSPLPIVNTFALIAWGVPHPGPGYVIPTAFGVACFIPFYACVQADGPPTTLLQWLRLNETRRTPLLP